MLAYSHQISLLKLVGHLKYAGLKVVLRPIIINPADNTLEVKWAVKGITGLQFILYLPKKWTRKNYGFEEAMSVWMEGISTYHVNDQGLVWKHVLDNRERDKDGEEALKATNKPIEKLKEKLEKLKERGEGGVPAPSL